MYIAARRARFNVKQFGKVMFIAVMSTIIVVNMVGKIRDSVKAVPSVHEVTIEEVTPYNLQPSVQEAILEEQAYNREHESTSRGYVRTADEVLAAKIVHCEADEEPESGQLAVLSVMLARAENDNTNLFGGPTLEGVAYHRLSPKSKHLFDCVDSDRWDTEPCERDYEIARKVIREGYRVYGPQVLYYYNPVTSTDKEFIASVQEVEQIGNHVFAQEKGVK